MVSSLLIFYRCLINKYEKTKTASSKLVFLFAGKAAQQVSLPIPEGCTDPNADNFDPTARSDDGSCNYVF